MIGLLRDLESQAAVIAGHLNVQHARAVAVLAEVMTTDDWRNHGVQSPEHWARLHLGVNAGQARMLCNVARKSAAFPDTMSEFGAGGLSLAQVEVIVMRAPEWADIRLAKFAPGLSVSQLRNTIRDEFFEPEPHHPEPCAEAGLTPPDAQPAEDSAPEPIVVAERPDYFGYEWRQGRLVVHGEFCADRGTALEAILENVRDQLFRATTKPATGAEALLEIVARAAQAPAGVALTELWGNGSRLGDVLGRLRTYLHLDIGDDGRVLAGHLSNGVRVPRAIVDYLTCDGEVTPVWEVDNTPVGYGRNARVVPVKMRRMVERRDHGCTVPGCDCAVFEVHHLVHWQDGGLTELANLLGLCPRHHRMHHLGLLTITGDPNRPETLEFRDSFGQVIAPTIPVKPIEEPPSPDHKFEAASTERFSLRQFYGWTEVSCRYAKRYEEFRAAQPPHATGDDPDPNLN